MIQIPKAVGLALCAAAMLTAPASASAEEFFFLSELKSGTTLTGAQDEGVDDVFTTTAGTVKCTETTVTGTLATGEASQVELTPAYSGCTSGSAGVTVKTNGCKYRFESGTIEGGAKEGAVDIVCTAENQIEAKMTFFGSEICTVKVPAQSNLGTVTYTNVESNPDTELTVSVSIQETLDYTHTGSVCGSGSSETGSYAAVSLVTGENAEEQVGIAAGQDLTLGVVFSKDQVSFKTHDFKVSKTTSFEVNNENAIPIELGNHFVEPNETDFKFLPPPVSTCPVKGTVNRKEKCTVYVEWVSGKKSLLKSFVLKFGLRFNGNDHSKKVDLIS